MNLIVGGALLGGCAAPASRVDVGGVTQGRSILVSATPSPGSTVGAPVDELRLRFAPPARLDEVLVAGPQGAMPMMVHAVGEVAYYAIPLSGLDAGAYTVSWRATARGQSHQGSFTFIVK